MYVRRICNYQFVNVNKINKGVIKLQKKRIIFVISSFLLVCILSVIAYFYYSYQTIKDENVKITNYPGDAEDYRNLENENMKDYIEVKGITNILLIGVDDRGTDEPVRADTIMILTLDDNNKKMKLTSIMRDTYVEIPGYGSEKINHAFAYGGINLIAQTIEKNFDISLQQYIKINFDGFKDLADSVGGLDLKINNYEEVNELNRCILLEIYDNPKSTLKKVKDITDSAGLLGLREEGATLIKNNPRLSKSQYNYISETAGFVENAGMVHLNGIQLLAYSRMRHVGAGSYERNERQRNVVNLLIDKLKDTPQIKYPSIVNKLLPYVKTNISITEALNLVYTTYKINNFAVEQLQVPATKLSDGRIYKNKGWVMLMNKDQNTKMLKEFIFDNISYDETKYSTFKYKNSEYYYEVTVIQDSKSEGNKNEKGKGIYNENTVPLKEEINTTENATPEPTEETEDQSNIKNHEVDVELQEFEDVNGEE